MESFLREAKVVCEDLKSTREKLKSLSKEDANKLMKSVLDLPEPLLAKG